MKRFIFLVILSLLLVTVFGCFEAGEFSFLWFLEADPIEIVIAWSVALAICSFAFGLVFGDYSWVDRLWSTAPVVYVWFYAFRGGFSFSILTSAILITLWGGRLTWNFARKGGYTGKEDYRWLILRKKITHPVLWQLFNLVFICSFQIGLFILFTSPVYLLIGNSEANSLFFIAAGLFILFLIWETTADQQQWVFHCQKRLAAEGGSIEIPSLKSDIDSGFLSSGLFRFSRHPNYFGEIAVWWTVYLIGASVSLRWFNWTLAGPSILSILFMGSTIFTESITGQKYPAYRFYQKTTSAIIPWVQLNKGGKFKNEKEKQSEFM